MQYSDHVLNTLIAPKLSGLTRCDAPEVPALPNYLWSLRMNQLLGSTKYKEAVKVLVANFIGRLGTAIGEYRLGRAQLLRYVENLPQHSQLASHQRAVSHFETCILHANIAIVCLNGLGKVLRVGRGVYVRGDGSDYDRLRCLNNRIKHFDEDVENATQENASSFPIAPLWITNEALEAASSRLLFSELADILVTQSTDAKFFAEDFFKETRVAQTQADASTGARG
jgi:hypothetical protein